MQGNLRTAGCTGNEKGLCADSRVIDGHNFQVRGQQSRPCNQPSNAPEA